MPLQKLARRPLLSTPRYPEFGVLELVIVFTIVKIFLELLADTETVVRRDCDVASVKQGVHVGAQQQAVVHAMRAAFAHRPNVGRLRALATLSHP